MGGRVFTWAMAAVAAAVLATPAQAFNVTGPNGSLAQTAQINYPSVSWSLDGVPDIDQARGTSADGTKVGLPNNGWMYCVPTTGMDFLAYLADRGFQGSLGVPSKDWTDPKNFNEMSVLLAQLGGEMGTDPVNGTGGNGFVSAMTNRLAKAEIGAVQVFYYRLDQNGGQPTVDDVNESGAAGDLLAAGIGFYNDETHNGTTYKRRVGGHAFAIVGGSAVVGSKSGTVFTRDPATVYTADTTQGAYTTDSHTIAPITTNFIWADSNGNDQTGTGTLATWDGSQTTLFEGFTRILPKTAWVLAGGKLKELTPAPLVPGGPVERVFDIPRNAPIKSFSLSAETNMPAFLVNGSSDVYRLDPLAGKATKLTTVPGATALTFGGPGQNLFVAGAQKLVRLDRSGRMLGSHPLSAPLAALKFNELDGQLAGLTSSGKLMLFNSKLHLLSTRTLPAIRSLSGTPLLAFGPQGNLIVGRSGQGKLFVGGAQAVASRRARARAASSLTLTGRAIQGGGKIRGLSIDDLGQALVSVNGKLRVFNLRGRTRAASPFNGLAADAVLAVARSFDNTAGAPYLTTLDKTPGPPPVGPTPAPDLIVHGVTNATTVLVRNVGDADAGPFSVAVNDADGSSQTVRFDSGLPAGAEAVLARYPCAPGRTYVADSGNEVAESDETNNTHSCG